MKPEYKTGPKPRWFVCDRQIRPQPVPRRCSLEACRRHWDETMATSPLEDADRDPT